MIAFLAYLLPLVLAGVALFASWVKCVADADGRPFYKRMLLPGWVFLAVVLVATSGLLFVQYANQKEQDDRLKVLSEATGEVRNASKVTLRELDLARTDLKKQSADLGEQGAGLKTTASRIEQLQLTAAGQTAMAVDSFAMSLANKHDELIAKRAELLGALADFSMEARLSAILEASHGDPQKYQRELLAFFDTIEMDKHHAEYVALWNKSGIPPERYRDLSEMLPSLTFIKNDLRTKPLTLGDLSSAAMAYRNLTKVYWLIAREISLECNQRTVKASMEVMNTVRPASAAKLK